MGTNFVGTFKTFDAAWTLRSIAMQTPNLLLGFRGKNKCTKNLSRTECCINSRILTVSILDKVYNFAGGIFKRNPLSNAYLFFQGITWDMVETTPWWLLTDEIGSRASANPYIDEGKEYELTEKGSFLTNVLFQFKRRFTQTFPPKFPRAGE